MADSKEALAERLAALRARREDARQKNQSETAEEDRKAKLPANFESRKRRAEDELAELRARKVSTRKKKKESKSRDVLPNKQAKNRTVKAEERGEDYDRLKALEVSADELERRARKRKKKNPDTGFHDYEQATERQYERLTKSLKPNMDAFEKSSASWSETDHAVQHGQHDKVEKEGIERMVADLKKQMETRDKYSRRRAVHQDADVDYINERNRRFNKKLERFYGSHTKEIKDSLERGTAI